MEDPTGPDLRLWTSFLRPSSRTLHLVSRAFAAAASLTRDEAWFTANGTRSSACWKTMRKGNDPSEATPGRLQKLYQPVCKSVRTLRLAWHAGARALTLRLPPARQLPPALRLPQALPLPPPRDQHSRVLMRCRLLPSALRPTGRKRPPIPQPKCRRNPPLHQPSARMMRVWPTRGHGKDLSLTRRALWSVQGPKQQGRAWVPRAASSIPPPVETFTPPPKVSTTPG